MGLIHSLPAARCTAFCRHFALYTCLSSCWHFSFCRPAPLCQLGKSLYYCNGPLFYTSCWCEPSLPLHSCFSPRLKQKMRDGFKASAKSSLFCASCCLCHGLEVSAQQSHTETDTHTQDRQAEGLFKEVQWKWGHCRAWKVQQCSTSLKPSHFYLPNYTHSSSLCLPLILPSSASSPCLPYRSASQTTRQSDCLLSTQDWVQISPIGSAQR